MPWSPTRSFPHPLAQVKSPENQKSDSIILSYTIVEMMTWQGLGDIINRFRERTLGLEPLTLLSASNYASRLKIPFTYCCEFSSLNFSTVSDHIHRVSGIHP